MGFFQAIRAAAGSEADFARAYAIAHEVGYHVQHLMGTFDKVRQRQARADQTTANRLSVRIELQADCFAGVWGHHTAERGIIHQQDVTTALQTAAQIGDDYLQRRARGTVAPETFTHGSSQQRVQWFERGLTSGEMCGSVIPLQHSSSRGDSCSFQRVSWRSSLTLTRCLPRFWLVRSHKNAWSVFSKPSTMP
jgi:uncharacterized protein